MLREGLESGERRRRFLQEAQAASSLNHPNIVTIHDVDSANGVDFIVMEYVDGTPLNRLIRPAGLPLDPCSSTRGRSTGALAAAHGAGIVHRDLKPSNIMLARDGRPKIVDFGLSKLSRPAPASTDVTVSSGPETARGIVMGSPGYMSPEQATAAAVDAASDVFALGVVFFEMASGTLPFRGDGLRSLLRDPPTSLSSTSVRSSAGSSRALSRDVWRRIPPGVTTRRSNSSATCTRCQASRRLRAVRRPRRGSGRRRLIAAAVRCCSRRLQPLRGSFSRRAAGLERAHRRRSKKSRDSSTPADSSMSGESPAPACGAGLTMRSFSARCRRRQTSSPSRRIHRAQR